MKLIMVTYVPQVLNLRNVSKIFYDDEKTNINNYSVIHGMPCIGTDTDECRSRVSAESCQGYVN